uniref:Uncharacterized protein n=1 Tax=Kalanchoe fedtschenkoi TaxID=63787 RepID=A0A7N0UKX8_KALFE
MSRQMEPLPFRTPQHPLFRTNNWGGASPLLARDLTKEALEQRYTRLNVTRMRDEIFPSDLVPASMTDQTVRKGALDPPTPERRRRVLVSSWVFFRREKRKAQLGCKRKRWNFPRWDPENRWPQGW